MVRGLAPGNCCRKQWSPCSATAETCSSASSLAISVWNWSCCLCCSRRNLASCCCFSLNSSSCKFCRWRRAASSVVNDALFATAIVQGLAANDPASNERRLLCDDFERYLRVHDLDPVLLTESCRFISLSALENHSSSVR